jgi:hypothetical protein
MQRIGAEVPSSPPEVVSASPLYTVQVRYRGGDWVTLARVGDRMAAVRRAAEAYRSATSGDGRLPTQVRLV